ncbi:hypothetical protein B0T11DRAFT_70030 [Plectosphaerella cucumerina]|uniref:Uncharacterized protein n=1 Tax=Plectosphaerella cucumerina TaxID=40658 RepID=A0A8K0X6N3_9PEZI|nr:hypothetical protein B0T11DRAFT_70030 [Plectosphaerella cucumerina]
MRRADPLRGASPLVLALSLLTQPLHLAQAYPYPLQNVNGGDYGEGLPFLMARDCVERCGVDAQYCCDSNTECFTSANIAGCSPKNGGGAWGIYTTTWTETKTFTATLTTHFAEPTGAGGGSHGVDCEPDLTKGESACGWICCADFQYCVEDGQCGQREGWYPPGGGGGEVTRTITSDGQTITTRFSAPFRPTGSTFSGATVTRTSTAATGTAIGSDEGNGQEEAEGTGGGLSAGAIAGIVIGVLAGLFLLGLLCFCCIVRGIWGLLCGGRKKDERRERVEVVEERYRGGSRAPSAAAHTHRERHTGWFGRPTSAGARRDEKDRGSGAKWLGLGAAAATLLALLNIRKDKKPERKPRSRYTDSYYSYSDPSESSRDSRSRISHLTSHAGASSAGGRTHRTRRSERAESRFSRR